MHCMPSKSASERENADIGNGEISPHRPHQASALNKSHSLFVGDRYPRGRSFVESFTTCVPIPLNQVGSEFEDFVISNVYFSPGESWLLSYIIGARAGGAS